MGWLPETVLGGVGFELVCLLNTQKDDKLVPNAAWTQEAACLRLSDVTLSASSVGFSSRSGDEPVEMVFDRESAIRRALFKLACTVKNCSTAGCGLSSLAEERSSEYVLPEENISGLGRVG